MRPTSQAPAEVPFPSRVRSLSTVPAMVVEGSGPRSRPQRGRGRLRSVFAALLAGVIPLALAAAPAAAAGGVTVSASVDGQPLAHSSQSHPIRLSPTKPATLEVQVTNASGAEVDLRTVRLEGRVVGLTFFAYDTSVNLAVAAGQSATLRYSLDLAGLDGQATGLIPGSVRLLDAGRHVVASQSMVSDVRGSVKSVYGLFGLALLLLTILATLGALLGLARHRLSPNRWLRAARFLTPGLGLGLVLVFTLSAFRAWVPTTGRWIVMILVCGAVFFVIGYLTPSPVEEGEEEEDEDDGPLIVGAGPPTPGPSPSPGATG
jgi:hypothetical protein